MKMLELAYCGDDCNLCPRYIATQSNSIEKLEETAALWKKAGWRENFVSPEEMVCYGCATVKKCRYDDIRKCAREREIDNCGFCTDYSCKKIENVFSQTEKYAKLCKKICSKEEYECLYKAFFLKKQNMDKVHKKC
jgi:hypothetical protein